MLPNIFLYLFLDAVRFDIEDKSIANYKGIRCQDIWMRFAGDVDICRMLEMCHSECGGTSGLHSIGTRLQPPSDLLRPSQCSRKSWRLDLTEHLKINHTEPTIKAFPKNKCYFMEHLFVFSLFIFSSNIFLHTNCTTLNYFFWYYEWFWVLLIYRRLVTIVTVLKSELF